MLQALADHCERVQAGGGASALGTVVPLGELERLSGGGFGLVVFSFRAIELGEIVPYAARVRFQQRQGGGIKRLRFRRPALLSVERGQIVHRKGEIAREIL